VVTFTVHEPPAPGSDRMDRGTELEFVKDGFSWLTAIFPPFGLLANGLWPFAIAYLAIASAFGWAMTALKVDDEWTSLVIFMVNIYLGFEVSTLKRWMLERRGWQTLGVVTGSSIAECERRFFGSWLPGQPIISSGKPGAPGPASVPQVPRGSRFWPFGAGA
jgi:uncharacterized protein DUF2628